MGIKRKINKLVQEQNEQTREEVLNRLHFKYPELNAQPKKRTKVFSWQRIAVSVCMACLLICAIVIPSVVFIKKGDGDNLQSFDRYCAINEYVEQISDETIKQYAQKESKAMLYFNWYEYALDCITLKYCLNETNEVLGLSETIFIEKPNAVLVEIKVLAENIILEGINSNIDLYIHEKEINNIQVKWYMSLDYMSGLFNYGDYVYIVTLYYEQDETKLFELIQELLE